MVDFSEALGIDPDILAGRLKFLSARAEWHLKQPEGRGRVVPGSRVMHLACAATLRRDAGAIALMLGSAEHARSEFMAAGYLRLELGFYDGFYLLRLGEVGFGDDRRVLGGAVAWLERSLHGGERERGGLPPYAAAASRSPR